jgi:hypothetical protein
VPRASRADWRALDRSIEGEVLLPESEAYEWERKPVIARFDEIKPRAVIRCAAAADVREVIAFARNNGIHVAARGGGHCVAGYSSTRGIVIDLAPMNSVAVTDGMARVGAGTRISELCERLDEHGLAIPTGTCPSVGLAGLTLGGGLGILGRAYGLTSDSLLAAQVVLADGRIAECDEYHHADLFWALRGAGAGNFGVVTEFAFAPRTAPRMTNFHLIWPFSAAAVLSAWQAWAPHGPDELAADLVLTAAGDERAEPSLEVYGAVIGNERDGRELLTALTARAGADPRAAECRELSYRDTCAYQAERSVAYDRVEQTPHGTRKRQGYRITKSEFFARPPSGSGDGRTDRHRRGSPPARSEPQHRIHALGRRLQRPLPPGDRVCPSRSALPGRARGHTRSLRAGPGKARRPPVDPPLMARRPSMGFGPRVSLLPLRRPR